MDTVYVLEHVREDDESEDIKLIGVFSTMEKAEATIIELSKAPGFKDYLAGFSIDEYRIDDVEWREGFGV